MSTVTEPKRWRLEIYGRDYTDDCGSLEFSMPSVVHEVARDDRSAMARYLGPKGFAITLTAPSERLRTLIDGGDQVRQVRVTVEGQSVRVPVLFHEEWVDRDGVRKMFGSLYVDPDREPKWVTESDVHAGERGKEGGQ